MPVTWQNDYNTEHDARIVDNVGKFRLNSPTLVHLHIWYNLWIKCFTRTLGFGLQINIIG